MVIPPRGISLPLTNLVVYRVSDACQHQSIGFVVGRTLGDSRGFWHIVQISGVKNEYRWLRVGGCITESASVLRLQPPPAEARD